jgi:hypothetical protein
VTEEEEERNGGGFEGVAFLGKGMGKGLEASRKHGRGLESSRTTALGFVLVAVRSGAMDGTRISWGRGWRSG